MPEMRVPISWLKEYVDIVLPLDKLAERMTLAGLEVNAIERIGAEWERDKLFVGKVLEVRPHPNANSLVLATVEYGASAPQTVVTGAPNLHVGDSGQKVCFATLGARLIDGHADEKKYLTLKPAKLRGVPSEGMVCSEKELGISDDHTGIIILPDDAPVGTPLVDYMAETTLVIEIVPNVARCLSIIGVAREVAALTKQKLHLKPPEWLAQGAPAVGQVEIEIADRDLCSRYSASIIRDVKIGPSPMQMRMRLIAAGMRPISNIVDVTNYVMLEWGQPLHAFDYDKLRARDGHNLPAIIVRRAKPGERMTTLDGVDRQLDPNMLLITDGGGPVGLAGVMGGLESEVTDATTAILLEAANFDYINNRRTAQILNLPSEAANRFGRGIDPELTIPVLKRASELMRVLGGGTIASGAADVYPVKPPTKVIAFSPSEVERLVGVKLSTSEIVEILESLEFRCETSGEGPIRVTVPSHRLDVTMSADLVEEVARIYGSENIPLTLMSDPLPPQRNNPVLRGANKTRDILAGCGLNEVICYSLIGNDEQGKLLAAYGAPTPYQPLLGAEGSYPVPSALAAEECIQLANPLAPEHRMMRTTLLPSLLRTVRDNLRYQKRVTIFEVANVYLPRKGQQLPDEPRHLSIAMTGAREAAWWAEKPAEQPAPMDFYDLKGVLETLLEQLGARTVSYLPADSLIFQPGRAARILVKEVEIGLMGELHPAAREAYDLPRQRIALLELDLDLLLANLDKPAYYKPISRFPLVAQDLALIMDEAVPAQKVEELILKVGGESIAEVKLFDVYRGEPIPVGKKSLAYAISYQDLERTLTDKNVARVREKIRVQLERELNAVLRSE
jgi:phenylalanyl-tRNA synthetase beta chain